MVAEKTLILTGGNVVERMLSNSSIFGLGPLTSCIAKPIRNAGVRGGEWQVLKASQPPVV